MFAYRTSSENYTKKYKIFNDISLSNGVLYIFQINIRIISTRFNELAM